MNEQLQNALVEILNRALAGIDTSMGFLSAELPDVVTQLLQWKMLEALVVVGLVTLCQISWVCFLKKIWKDRPSEEVYQGGFRGNWAWESYKHYRDSPELEAGVGCFNAIIFLILVFATFPQVAYLFEALQILVAPKIYLIEYVSELTKRV